MLFFNTVSVVYDFDADFFQAPAVAAAHRAVVAVNDGVIDQIDEHLSDAIAIGEDLMSPARTGPGPCRSLCL